MARSIYYSKAGKAEIMELYDQAVAQLGVVYEERTLETRFGSTHVLITGPADAPPLFILHGGNVINPVTLAWYLPLSHHYRLYAPDLIGHPGKSAQTRLSPDDDSYARWGVDVLNGLDLIQVPFIGLSFGAAIVLRMAAYAPERIAKAVLHAPAGLVHSPTLTLLRDLAWPMWCYRWWSSRMQLRQVLRPLTGDRPIDDLLSQTLGAVFRNVRIETHIPRPARREGLLDFNAPTLVVAAEHDIFFPAEAVKNQARLTIPNLVMTECLKGGYHLPTKRELRRINERIDRFLNETRCPIYPVEKNGHRASPAKIIEREPG